MFKLRLEFSGMVSCLHGEDCSLGIYLGLRGERMKKVLAKLFPSVFSLTTPPEEVKVSSAKVEGDDKFMTHLGEVNGYPVALYKGDGGEAHPVWARSVEAEKARKKRGWFHH